MDKSLDTAYLQDGEKILESLNSQRSGLSDSEAASRQLKFGPNLITAKKKFSAFSIYIEQFRNTLTMILIGSTVLMLFIYYFGQKDPSDLVEAALILLIILIMTTLGFIQEFKAEKSIESLKQLLAYRAKVKRNGIEKEIDVKDLVPGDIVILEEGTKVPADIRLLEVWSLSASEASLTGESTPVGKITEKLEGAKQISDQNNMVFSATSIASGRALGVVVRTADQTEIGKIANIVAQTPEGKTPIQEKLDKIGKTLGFVILGICASVFIFVLFFAQDFTKLPILGRIIQSFIAAVALAVAAIPEGLPAVVTISLALGTRRMLAKNALVRKLNSVETLGSTDVICADKTGTLTRGEMTVVEIYLDNNLWKISAAGLGKETSFTLANKPVDPKPLLLLLQTGLECNNATIGGSKSFGDPTEIALLISAKKAQLLEKSPRVLEIPFSSERKMMSVVVKSENNYCLYSKGAPEIILAKCTKFIKNGKEQSLTNTDRAKILDQTRQMSQRALRNLGFATKQMTGSQFADLKKQPEKHESDLVFVGIQAMIDPPRVEIKPLIENCNSCGIRVIMITGDHIETARAVASEIGIEGLALTGEELDKIGNMQFKKIVENVNIYARINPSTKMRIVEALKENGHVVAMTGDGVNDAPALKRADIGIAMGITGTDVAKEASDMVLLDDNFSSIVTAIKEGRSIFQNIKKFVTYLLSCNIGEILIVFFAVILFQKLPLTATMLLWINVVTDGIPAVFLSLDPATHDILKKPPSAFQTEVITIRLWVEMLILGALLSVIVLTIYSLNLNEGKEAAQGAAFMATVIIELVNLYVIRSAYKTSLFTNPKLLMVVLTTIFIQILIIFIPFSARLFEVSAISPVNWIYITSSAIALWLIIKPIRIFLDKIPALNRN